MSKFLKSLRTLLFLLGALLVAAWIFYWLYKGNIDNPPDYTGKYSRPTSK